MKRNVLLWMSLFVAVGALLGGTCDDGSDGDEASDDDESTCWDSDDTNGSDCEDNQPPLLLGLDYFVNFEMVEPPVVVTTADSLELGVHFRDPDCNAGPLFVFLNSADEGYGTNQRFADAPCSTVEAGEPLRFNVDPEFFAYSAAAPFSLTLDDNCGENGRSATVPLEVEGHRTEPECGGNRAPELQELQLLINGEPENLGVSIECEDHVELLIDYADADCNLEGGWMHVRYVATGHWWSAPIEWKLLGVGCSSAAVGHPFRIDAPGCESEIYGEEPVYEVFINDRCDESNGQIVNVDCPTDCSDHF